jgi:hypothetical protein
MGLCFSSSNSSPGALMALGRFLLRCAKLDMGAYAPRTGLKGIFVSIVLAGRLSFHAIL